MRVMRLWATVGLGLGVIAAVYGGWSWADARRSQLELELAKSEMAAGHFKLSKAALNRIGEAVVFRRRASLSAWSLRRGPRSR